MSINTLSIVQDNKIGSSNLLSIHNPLSFICEVFYSGQTPNWIYCDVLIDGELHETYKAVPFKDVTGTLRHFAFFADEIIRQILLTGLNEIHFNDFGQSASTLDYVPNLTREITISFRDPDGIAEDVSVLIDFCNASSQYGDVYGANLYEQYINQTDIYYCAKGGVCYVYFYNDNVNNVLSINGLVETSYAIDADDSIFTDSNGDRFLI